MHARTGVAVFGLLARLSPVPRDPYRSAIMIHSRMRLSLPLLIAAALLCKSASGQGFSRDPDYLSFYHANFDPNTESGAESTIAIWWIVEKFGDLKISLSTLHKLLKRHATLYPATGPSDVTSSYLKVVGRMLRETRPDSAKVIECHIYDLRFMNLIQLGRGRGNFVITRDKPTFTTKEGRPYPDAIIKQVRANENAADRLRDIGYDCIPNLIDHIDDDTLTRTVRHGDSTVFSHEVVTVGECCIQLIDFILPSGRQFDMYDDDTVSKKRAMMTHYMHLISRERAEQ